MTREQFALILYRFAKAQGKNTQAANSSLNAYSDHAQVSAWAAPGVKFAMGSKALSGASISPRTTVSTTDADAALTVLNRL